MSQNVRLNAVPKYREYVYTCWVVGSFFPPPAMWTISAKQIGTLPYNNRNISKLKYKLIIWSQLKDGETGWAFNTSVIDLKQHHIFHDWSIPPCVPLVWEDTLLQDVKEIFTSTFRFQRVWGPIIQTKFAPIINVETSGWFRNSEVSSYFRRALTMG